MDRGGLARTYVRGVKKALKEIYEAGEEGFFGLADDFEGRDVPVYEKYINPLEKRGVPSFPFTTGVSGIVMVMVGLFLYSLLVSPNTTVVEFRVVDTQNHPIDGALVQINDAFSKKVETYSYTISGGKLLFNQVPAGKALTYAAYKPGYERKSASIGGSERLITIVMRCVSGDCGTKAPALLFSNLNVCADGTPIGECSVTRRPLRCKNGVMVPDASCGCDAGFTFKDGTCVPDNGCGYFCPDGTLIGSCSASKPLECNSDLTLTTNAQKCGCPPGFFAQGNVCKPERTTTDCPGGVPRLACSPSQPFYCNRDGKVETRGDLCGCPEGFTLDGTNCKADTGGGATECADNTAKGQCSTTRPFYCNDALELVSRESCGCGPNYRYANGVCEPQQRPTACSDGTAFGTCSRNKPFRCSETGVLENAASSCGCPDGFDLNSADDSCKRREGTYFCTDGTQSTKCSADKLFVCDATCTLKYAPTSCSCTPNLAILSWHPTFAWQTLTIKTDRGTLVVTMPPVNPGKPTEWPVILYVAQDGTLYYGDDAHDGTGNRLNFEQAASIAHRVDPSKAINSAAFVLTAVTGMVSTRGDVSSDLRQGEIYAAWGINAKSGSRELPGNHFGYLDRFNKFVLQACTDNSCSVRSGSQCGGGGGGTPTPTPGGITPTPTSTPTPTPTPGGPYCGDGICQAPANDAQGTYAETCLLCPMDCGVCPPEDNTGDVEARVSECGSGQPIAIPNAVVVAGGVRGVTDSVGRVLLTQVPAGIGKPVDSFKDTYLAYQGSVDVPLGGIAHANLCLRANTAPTPLTGSVQATITSCKTQQPIPLARVFAGGIGGETDSSGSVLLARVPVGTQPFDAFANSYKAYKGQVTVFSNQVASARACLEETGGGSTLLAGDCSSPGLMVYSYAPQPVAQTLGVETESGVVAIALPAFSPASAERPIAFYIDSQGKAYFADSKHDGTGARLTFEQATAVMGSVGGGGKAVPLTSQFAYEVETTRGDLSGSTQSPVLYLGWGYSTTSGSDKYPANAFGYVSASGAFVPAGCRVNDWQVCRFGRPMAPEVVQNTCANKASAFTSYPSGSAGANIGAPSVPDKCTDGTLPGQCSVAK
jgi:hypothetical protein